MSSSDEAEAGDSLFGDFFVNKAYVAAALPFGEGAALRTLRLQVRVTKALLRCCAVRCRRDPRAKLSSRRCRPRLAPTTT